MLLQHGNVRHIVTYPGTMFEIPDPVLTSNLASSRHFHLSSLSSIVRCSLICHSYSGIYAHRSVTISLDTNDDPDDLWAGVLDDLLPLIDILMPNEAELRRIARRNTVEESLSLLSQRVPLIVVKCGARGDVQQGGIGTEVPSLPINPLGHDRRPAQLQRWIPGSLPPRPFTGRISCGQGAVAGSLSTLRPGGTEAFRDASLRESFLEHWPQLADA